MRIAYVLVAIAAAANGIDTPAIDAKGAFERLKLLAGEWEATTQSGPARVRYEVIGGGTALVEREKMPGMPDMMTVYHLDGERLLLTHYCMAGNQPRMQARGFDAKTGEIRFEFLDATNLANKNAGHMHAVTIRTAGKDQLSAAWEFHEDGRRTFGEKLEYVRVK